MRGGAARALANPMLLREKGKCSVSAHRFSLAALSSFVPLGEPWNCPQHTLRPPATVSATCSSGFFVLVKTVPNCVETTVTKTYCGYQKDTRVDIFFSQISVPYRPVHCAEVKCT